MFSYNSFSVEDLFESYIREFDPDVNFAISESMAEKILDELAIRTGVCPTSLCEAFNLPPIFTIQEWVRKVRQMDSDRRKFFIHYAAIVRYQKNLFNVNPNNLSPEERVEHGQCLDKNAKIVAQLMDRKLSMGRS